MRVLTLSLAFLVIQAASLVVGVPLEARSGTSLCISLLRWHNITLTF